MVRGGVGEMGNFVVQMLHVDRFLRSVFVDWLDSGQRLLEELLFFTLFMNAFFMGPEQGSEGRVVGRISIIEFIILISCLIPRRECK